MSDTIPKKKPHTWDNTPTPKKKESLGVRLQIWILPIFAVVVGLSAPWLLIGLLYLIVKFYVEAT